MGAELLGLLATSLLFGLLGAGHCVAMCGGIASALAMREPGLTRALAQHAGRISAYIVLGVAAGALALLGEIAPVLATLTRGLRLLAVLMVFGIGLALLLGRQPWDGPARFGMQLWRSSLARFTSGAARGTGLGAAWTTGLAWGFLPCGMSWTAATANLAAGPGVGALAMLAFGLGTLIGVLPFSLAGATLGHWLTRPAVRRAAGAALLALALVMAWTLWPGAVSAGHQHH
jgi:sulfite exporter TauE/SafE